MTQIKNAIIASTTINTAERDLLTAWLHLEYDAGGKGLGDMLYTYQKAIKTIL